MGLDITASQAHAMIGHSAQAILAREQHHHHFAAAVRSNLNSIASLSAQQILLNNGRLPGGNAYQQPQLSQFGVRNQMQPSEEVSMMASAGLLMTGHRALNETFPTLGPNQSQSLMYLTTAKGSNEQFTKRPSSAGTLSNVISSSFARPSSAGQVITKEENHETTEKIVSQNIS